MQLHKQAREQNLTSAQLLELWRGTREEKLLRQLVTWEHHLDQDKISQEFFDTFLYFIDLFVEQRANELLAKEREAPLTHAEKKEYMALMQHRAQQSTSGDDNNGQGKKKS